MVKNILTTYNSNLFERMLSSNYALVGPLDPLTSSIFQSEGQVQLRMKLSVIRPVLPTVSFGFPESPCFSNFRWEHQCVTNE